jgi:hypothetical protein
MAGKRWDEAALPKGAIGYGAPYNATPGDLYAVFPDGTYQLLEKGFGARQTAEAKAANVIADAENARRAAINQAATPPTPVAATVTSNTRYDVKVSERDSILFPDETISATVMETLVFEDIGGHELLNIARRDTINGQKVIYQPIRNLTEIEQQYNPNNVINVEGTADRYFSNFPIKLELKIPEVGGGPDSKNVYFNSLTGDLVVDSINLEPDEQIEIQIAASGTIYEADM